MVAFWLGYKQFTENDMQQATVACDSLFSVPLSLSHTIELPTESQKKK